MRAARLLRHADNDQQTKAIVQPLITCAFNVIIVFVVVDFVVVVVFIVVVFVIAVVDLIVAVVVVVYVISGF